MTGDTRFLEPFWKVDYERVPVSPRQFLEDDYYLGKSVKNLSPVWKKEFEIIFSPTSSIITVIITGAIGTGKTTFASICKTYKMYQLSCLKDPVQFYGLLPGSKIVFGVYNITLDKADDLCGKVIHYVDNSPYFNEYCVRKKKPKDLIIFPDKNIEVSVGSLGTHALGDNILGYTVDEANFFKRSRSIGEIEKTRAHQIFHEAQTRLYSRFMKGGDVPGLVILISSRKFVSSFTDSLIEKARTDPEIGRTTRVIEHALWETKNKKDFSGETFKVLIGTEFYDSRVLELDEIVPEDAQVIEVPVEYKRPFLDDCDLAIRDIAGISTKGSSAFFPVKQRIFNCIDKTRSHPFTKSEITIPLGKDFQLEEYLDEKSLVSIIRSIKTPHIHPGAGRFVHIDIAYSEENLGMSMVHPFLTKDDKLAVYVDFMLRMRPPVIGELDLDPAVDFMKHLRKIGFNIVRVTFDRYQSRMPIQHLIKAGFRSDVVSIVLQHYVQLKTLFNEGRISLYDYLPFREEVDNLMKNEDETKRPEHAIGFNDDLLDSLAGAVSCALNIDSTSKKGDAKRRVKVIAPSSSLVIGMDGDDY